MMMLQNDITHIVKQLPDVSNRLSAGNALSPFARLLIYLLTYLLSYLGTNAFHFGNPKTPMCLNTTT